MQQNKPKITVVTVTYNAEEYLEETIKNVIEQDYPNIEYIIIDGASTDGTVNIIKQYEKYITYWISEPDEGIYDAMNKAIDVATGEWINFMNAGDSFCEKNTILKVIRYLDNKYDLVGGDCFYLKNQISEYQKASGLKDIFSHSFCCHQSLFSKVSMIKKLKFNTEYKIIADYDFILKAYKNNYNFYLLDFPIANYLSGGFYENNSFKAAIEHIYIISKYVEDPLDIFKSKAMEYIENFKPKNTLSSNLIFSKLINSFENNLNQLDLKNKRFILYGFGTIGKLIYSRYKEYIICIIDKDYINISKNMDTTILSPEVFLNLYKNEYVFISVLGREDEIIKMLETSFNLNRSNLLTIKI